MTDAAAQLRNSPLLTRCVAAHRTRWRRRQRCSTASQQSQQQGAPLVQVKLGDGVEGAALLAEALLAATHDDAGVARVRLAHLVASVVVFLLGQVAAAALHLCKGEQPSGWGRWVR